MSERGSDVKTERRSGPFVEKVSIWLILIAALGGFIVLLDPAVSGKVFGFEWKIGVGDFSAELKGAVVNTMLLGGFSGVVAYWLGATKSQERSTDSLSRIAEQTAPASAAAAAAAAIPAAAAAAAAVANTPNGSASPPDPLTERRSEP